MAGAWNLARTVICISLLEMVAAVEIPRKLANQWIPCLDIHKKPFTLHEFLKFAEPAVPLQVEDVDIRGRQLVLELLIPIAMP